MIVLLYPRVEPDFPDPDKLLGLPLSVLTVARPLVANGYDVRIFDQNVDPHVEKKLQRIESPLFVGISCLGGHQIKSGLRLAAEVRKAHPGVTLVWGGWNPTLLPHLYRDARLRDVIDVVVRGRGEIPCLEIARRLENGEGFDGIAGVFWRDAEGREHDNADAPLDDPTDADILPYDLIDDFDGYITRHGTLNFVSSYGCPHRCSFCGIPAHTKTFRPIANQRVVDQLAQVRSRGIHTIVFYDDNFFTSKPRVIDLADRLLERNLSLGWHCNGRLDQLLRFDVEELRKIARAGCRSVNVGYETGDQQVADGVFKDIQVGDIDELARRFREASLHLSVNFMVGLPGETPESLVRSMESLHRIYSIQPDMDVCWYIFMPPPATRLWDELAEQGLLTHPSTLEEHAELQSLYLEHPWYYESPKKHVFREWRSKHKALAWYFFVAYGATPPNFLIQRWGFRLLRRWCRFRFERRLFRHRWDWRLCYILHAARVRWRWMWAWMTNRRRGTRRPDRGDKTPGEGAVATNSAPRVVGLGH